MSRLDKGRLVICQKIHCNKIRSLWKNFYFSVKNRMKHNENLYTSRQGLTCHIWREQGQVTLTFHPLIYECNDQMSRGFVQLVSTNFPLKGCLPLQTSTTLSAMRALVLALILAFVGECDDGFVKLCCFINMFKNNADFIFGGLLIVSLMVMSM